MDLKESGYQTCQNLLDNLGKGHPYRFLASVHNESREFVSVLQTHRLVLQSKFQPGPLYPEDAVGLAPAIAALRALSPLCRHVAVLLRFDYAGENELSPKVLMGCDRLLYDDVSKVWRSELLPVLTRYELP